MARDLNLLHPEAKKKAEQLIEICRNRGIEIIITQTLRTKAEQDGLYAQGRSKSGNIVTNCRYPQSLHCWGVAFDFAVMIGGKVNWTHLDSYNAVGSLGKSLGLVWGGDWKNFVDRPHFELPGYRWSALQKKHGTPEKFKATWPKQSTTTTGGASEVAAWKKQIIKDAKYAGLISSDHNPDDPAPKWFVLQVMLNMMKKVG